MAAHAGSAEITLRTLVTARWVLVGLLASIGLADALFPWLVDPLLAWFPASPDPVGFCVVLVLWATANLATMRTVLSTGRASSTVAGIHLLLDAVALTGLLALSGGATNPFTTLYFVPITLATQVSPRWTWALAVFCLAGFAALFVLHPIPTGPPGHEAHFAGHLRGMWVAFGVSGALITTFVHRIALSLARQRDELVRLREDAIRDRHLASLGTLAAGAAHELGTPLGSIQLLVGELSHMSEADRATAVDTIKQEVARCKTIVQSMATPEVRISAFASGGEVWRLERLADGLSRPSDVPITLQVGDRARGPSGLTTQPREPLAQILRELVANAAEACRAKPSSRGVTVLIDVEGDEGVLEVHDDGIGMDPQIASGAFDPFFSTKPEGEGMGLGLYLARARLRQLGGRIELVSNLGQGTQLEIRLPLRPKEDAAA